MMLDADRSLGRKFYETFGLPASANTDPEFFRDFEEQVDKRKSMMHLGSYGSEGFVRISN